VNARLVAADGPGHGEALAVLRSGGLVAIPTDTVYGISVALETPGGVERLFAAKDRPPDKAIMVLVDSLEQANRVVEVTELARALATRFWPGGLTLVLRVRPETPLPAALTAGTGALGVRMPNHPTPRALARSLGPLPTTSANRSGEPECRDAEAVAQILGDRLDLIVDGGRSPGGVPSTVVDCMGPQPVVLRAGAVDPEEVFRTAGPPPNASPSRDRA
jgi:L-threonylcarbamoyladenylate synthase